MSRAMLAHWRACAPALGYQPITLSLTVPDDSLQTLRVQWVQLQDEIKRRGWAVFGLQTTIRTIDFEGYPLPEDHDLCRIVTLYCKGEVKEGLVDLLKWFFTTHPHREELPFSPLLVVGLPYWDAEIQKLSAH